MAARKVTVSVDEELLNEVTSRTDNLSRYVASALRWKLALDRQARAIDQFIEETGITPDPEESERARQALNGRG
ncbi:MAG TPA: hypothetical protein VK009_00630 [Chloroflexota bacterium]|nr:hypothetical protein [Chloroflexota bacterium]